MKFVALALTILLAAGSQARFLQADAPEPPSPLEHVRSAGGLYLDEVKKVLQKALEHLDGTEYEEHKQKISEGLDTIRARIKTGSDTAAPYTDALAVQLMEAIKDMRKKFTAEVADLKTKITPMGEQLQTVVKQHIEQYREKFEPKITEVMEKHKKHMEEVKTSLEPVLADLRVLMEKNLEETKSKLEPILELLHQKATEYLEALQKEAAPYITEYKEHIIAALDGTKGAVSPDTEDLQAKLQPFSDALKSRFRVMLEAFTQPKSS